MLTATLTATPFASGHRGLALAQQEETWIQYVSTTCFNAIQRFHNMLQCNTTFSQHASMQYNVSTTCFNAITGTEPQYLYERLHLYSHSRELRSSTDTQILKIPRSYNNSKIQCHRSFSYAGPFSWNDLQYNLTATCQYNCTRNALWCQVHTSHIHTNHKTSLNYNNNSSKHSGKLSDLP